MKWLTASAIAHGDSFPLPFLPGYPFDELTVAMVWWAFAAFVIVVVCVIAELATLGKKWWPPRLAALCSIAFATLIIWAIVNQGFYEAAR
ncbi:hypothetical protein ACFVAJ_18060 [Agromyces sp. NPDC057679]|uniref:hypothetical protein n=1 Tax=Agromyces sp. NPDC057679 TaxID=3346207 RepID=UPI003670BB3C